MLLDINYEADEIKVQSKAQNKAYTTVRGLNE